MRKWEKVQNLLRGLGFDAALIASKGLSLWMRRVAWRGPIQRKISPVGVPAN
jgi:hypothetical protein